MLLVHGSHQLCCRFIVSIYLNNLCDIALVCLLCFSHPCLKSNMPFAILWRFAAYLKVKFPHFLGWRILNMECFVRGKTWFIFSELVLGFLLVYWGSRTVKYWNAISKLKDLGVRISAVAYPNVETDLHEVQCLSTHANNSNNLRDVIIQLLSLIICRNVHPPDFFYTLFWHYVTGVLKKNNKATAVFQMYRSCRLGGE